MALAPSSPASAVRIRPAPDPRPHTTRPRELACACAAHGGEAAGPVRRGEDGDDDVLARVVARVPPDHCAGPARECPHAPVDAAYRRGPVGLPIVGHIARGRSGSLVHPSPVREHDGALCHLLRRPAAALVVREEHDVVPPARPLPMRSGRLDLLDGVGQHPHRRHLRRDHRASCPCLVYGLQELIFPSCAFWWLLRAAACCATASTQSVALAQRKGGRRGPAHQECAWTGGVRARGHG
eukprot:scaffold9052_cov107-Isochrysis_galbana.AAC.10